MESKTLRHYPCVSPRLQLSILLLQCQRKETETAEIQYCLLASKHWLKHFTQCRIKYSTYNVNGRVFFYLRLDVISLAHQDAEIP